MKKAKGPLPPQPPTQNLLSLNLRQNSKLNLAIPIDVATTPNSSRGNFQVDSARKRKIEKKNSTSALSSRGGNLSQNLFKDSQPETGIEKKELIYIKFHLKKAKDYVFAFAQFNHSSIIQDSKLLSETESLSQAFLPFQKEANEYFHQLNELKTPIQKIPIQTLKGVTFSFLQKWKEFVRIIELIRENGYASMFHYISIKFRKIDFIIHDIVSNQRRNSVHAETLEKRGGCLQSLLHNLKNSIKELLLNVQISSLEPDRLDFYINDIKTFTRLYNEAHFQEFPKSGCMQIELSQFKTEVMAECSDIIEALRSSFNLHTDIGKIFNESNEITQSLQKIINKINLPQTFYTVIPKEKIGLSHSNDQNSQSNDIKGDISKIESFINEKMSKPSIVGPVSASINNPEKNIVLCAKLEAYIDKLEDKLLIEKDLEKDVWDRLEVIQNEFFERLNVAEQRVQTFKLYQKEIENQASEISKLMEESNEKSAQISRTKREFNDEIESLKQKISDLENDNKESLNEIERKNELIKRLKTENDNKAAQETLNRIGKKMGSLMNDNEANLDFHKEDENIQTVDKMSVFILERRCQKCREYEEMRKNIRKILAELIGLKEGETILQAIDRLRDEVVKLRDDNARLYEDNEKALFDMTELRRCLVEVISDADRDMLNVPKSLDDKNAQEIARVTRETLENLRKFHQEELKKLEENLKGKHNAELFEISNKLNPLSRNSKVLSKVRKDYNQQSDKDENNSAEEDNIKDLRASLIKASNYKDLVLEQLKLANERMTETDEQLNFAKELLYKVEKWMNIQSELTTDKVPIDQALIMMMDAIEHKPNPLEKVVNNLNNKLYLIDKNILLITDSVQKMLNKDGIDPSPERMELFERINYLQVELSFVINKYKEATELAIEQSRIISECRSTFNTIGKKMFHVLMKDDSIFNPNYKNEEGEKKEAKIDEIMLQCLTAVDDVSNPNQRLFMPIVDLNNMTKEIRKNAKLPPSLDPLVYIPLLDETLKQYHQTIKVIEDLQPSLISIFSNFDFKVDSMDPECYQFSMLRENIFHMQTILMQQIEGDAVKVVNDVIQSFVAMSASFVSSIASVSFKSFSLRNKDEIMKFCEQQQQKNQKGPSSNIYVASNSVDKYNRHPYFKL